MQCSKDPSGRSSLRPPPPPPVEELLTRLKPALLEALTTAAETAQAELQGEGIYGFALFHGQLLYAHATVFTEAALDEKVRDYQQRGHATSCEGLRWSPCDSPHHMYADEAFGEVEEIFMDLDQHPQGEFSTGIEQTFLWCLQQLRAASILSPDVTLLLMEGDQSGESMIAYAELFNSPEAVSRFRSELSKWGSINEAHLEHWRSVMPSFGDS